MKKSIYPSNFIKAHTLNAEHTAYLPTDAELKKMNTEECGVGIFAQRYFRRGELIGTFLAEHTTKILQHSLQQSPTVQLHDPHFVGFLLHSCSPNVVLDMHQQKVFCIQDIETNSPLTMDYASTEDQLYLQFACGCGAPNCRKWISGRAEPINEAGRVFLAEQQDANTDSRTLLEDVVLSEFAAL